MTGNGWDQYQRLVLNELTKHGDKLEKLSEQMIKHGEELAQLRVKAGIWGAVSGAVVGIGSFIMSKL